MAADPFESILACADQRVADPMQRPALATWIEEDDSVDGGLYFAGEIELQRIYMPRGAPWEDDVHTWMRLEYKAGYGERKAHRQSEEVRRQQEREPQRNTGWIDQAAPSPPGEEVFELEGRRLKEKTLAMAVWPWSYEWDRRTPLRNYSKNTRTQRHERLANGTFDSRDVLMRYLEGLLDDSQAKVGLKPIPWDFWETGERIVTAGLPQAVLPSHLENAGGAVQNFAPGTAFCLGICRDFEASVAKLRRAKKLIDLEEALASDRGAGSLPSNARSGKPDDAIHDAAVYRLAEDVDRAIRCALAGPPDMRRWLGRPVVDLVVEILRTLVNNANRNATDREKRVLSYQKRMLTDAAELVSPTVGAAREFALELCGEEPDRAWQKIRAWLADDEPPQYGETRLPLGQLLGVVVDALLEQHASDDPGDSASATEALERMRRELGGAGRADLHPIRTTIAHELGN